MIVIFSIVAGSLVVMWLGELITEYGVGNGASLIIMAGIIARIPHAMYTILDDPEFWRRCCSWPRSGP
jgi:preprotein translocase subunit SecY